MLKPVALLAAALALSGCGTLSSAALSAQGPDFVGKPASALFAAKGPPKRELHAPSGATIYVYETHNMAGNSTFCEGSFYVRDQTIVGFQANGQWATCTGSAGETY
jgi:hypothetical protein